MQPPIERHRRAAQPPEGISRSSHARTDLSRRAPGEPAPRRRSVPRVPSWLTGCLVGVLVVSLALFAAEQLMRGYLARVQAEKEAAYRRTVEAHPFYEGDIKRWIGEYAAKNNLHTAFVASIILNESSFSPTAESRLGARGLMQLMEDTAQWINDQYLHEEGYTFRRMYDPETNIRFGCWYLGYLSRQFRGDPVAVTAAYHAGQNNVRAWLSRPEVSPDGKTLALSAIPTQDTRQYAERVMRDYAIYDALYLHDFNRGDTAIVDPALR